MESQSSDINRLQLAKTMVKIVNLGGKIANSIWGRVDSISRLYQPMDDDSLQRTILPLENEDFPKCESVKDVLETSSCGILPRTIYRYEAM